MYQQPQQAMPLGLDSILSELDDADIEEIECSIPGLPALDAPAPRGGLRARQQAYGRTGRRKVWLFNAAWIALCLVILTGAALFAWHMLAR